jgi:hypothetical protein
MSESGNVVPPNSSDPAGEVPDYRQKLDEVATLVARVRHEINNPLTGRAESIEQLALRLKDIVGQLREVQKPGS